MRLTRLLTPAAVAGVAAMGLVACQKVDHEAVPETTADLSARFDVATVYTALRRIDFGTLEAREFLVSGWSADKSQANGLGFVTSQGPSSTLRFPVPAPRDLPIRFRCRPLPEGPPVDSISLELNSTIIATIPLQAKLGTYSTVLPKEHLMSGENRLTFHYGLEPTGKDEPGEPKVKWIRMQLDGGDRPEDEPFADTERRLVFLPFDSRIDFPVVVDDRSRLWLERIDFSGGTKPALEISVRTDGREDLLERIDAPRRDLSLALAQPRADVVHLSLRAESSGSWSQGDGVYLRAPEIRSKAFSPPVDSRPVEASASPAARPNILVYLVDTLRPDRVSAYGYSRPTTPRLDAFAATATLFEKGVGQSSWTRPSVASIFTGQWPGDHSITERGDALSQEAITLAELLRQAGYQTASVSTNPNIAKAFGFDQGFDHFELLLERADSTDANDAVFQWLNEVPDEKPFFLFVQPADPHTPYLPPEPFRSKLAADADEMYDRITATPSREIWEADAETLRQINALYDAEIAANDDSFGKLLGELAERGLLDEMLVVFISDHGEEFMERGGWTHGRTLHAETLDFPLLIKMPGQTEGARVSEVAQHVDILPTIAEIAGLELTAPIEGRSLLPVLEPRRAAGRSTARPFPARPAFSHVGLVRGLTTSIVVGEWKLIDRQRKQGRATRLYRWTEDAAELEDLAGRYPLRTSAMRALLDEKLASKSRRLTKEQAVLDPEIEQRLRALGYL